HLREDARERGQHLELERREVCPHRVGAEILGEESQSAEQAGPGRHGNGRDSELLSQLAAVHPSCSAGRERSQHGRTACSPSRAGAPSSHVPESRHAIDPPPAPTVWMSSVVTRRMTPPISRSNASSGVEPRTRATSVLVPPMSKVAMSSYPA